MAAFAPFLGGNSGGSSSLSSDFKDADFTVTTLEEEVRESLLEAKLCFEGDPGEALESLRSSLDADDLVLFVGDLSMVLDLVSIMMSPWEADFAKLPVLMDMLL